MEPLLSTRTGDLPGLVMENELLRYEVVHLRARLAACEHQVQQLHQAQETRAVEGMSTVGDAATAAVTADLTWLLERLEGSPASRLLRRRQGYRTLVERYLGDGPHDA